MSLDQKAALMPLFCVIGILFFFGSVKAEMDFSIKPRISVATEYDDNVYFTQTEAISDVITYISPGINARVQSPGGVASIDYQLQWVFYAHQSSRNSDRHYLSLDGWKDLPGSWRFSFHDDYMKSEDPILVQQTIGGIKYEDLKYDYNEGDADISVELGEDGYLKIGYHSMFFRNRSSDVADTVSHYPYIDVKYWFSRPWGIRLQFGEDFALFDYSDDFNEPQGNLTLYHRLDIDTTISASAGAVSMNFNGDTADYAIYDLGLGLTRAFTENSGIALGAGYYYQDVYQGIEDEDGLSGYINLWIKTVRYSLSIEITKGYDEVYFDGEDLGFSHCSVFGASFNYLMAHALSLGIQTYYREDTFPQALPHEVKERTWEFECDLGWMVNNWLSVSVGYTHWDRDANSIDYEYQDNRLMLKLTASKGLSL